LGLKFKYLAA